MSSLRQETINTYNKSARQLAEYFRGIGSRVSDIEYTMQLNQKENPDVLEIGCGDGRDAKEITKRSGTYLGFDISAELIKLARKHVPDAEFEVADACTFDYGIKKYDIVFAFASLLHLNIEEIESVFDKTYESLRPEGVMFISMKYSPKYEERVKEDRFGKRVFYFYNTKTITDLVKDKFEVIDRSRGFTTGSNTKWFELALVKK